jgi:prepilin-type N-terminal cleavage/methylation domain-containing protein
MVPNWGEPEQEEETVNMSRYMEKREEQGFTLIELLIAIVVVGVLTAVAIVGIAGLTDEGNQSACDASKDAATAASAVHYANTGSYPADFEDMEAANELEVPGGNSPMANGDLTMAENDWTLTMAGGTPPTFTCTVT